MTQQPYREDGIKTCSASEALRGEQENLVVEENQTVAFSPANRDVAHHFVRVRLTGFEDLQTIGFVPRRLSEDAARRAILADNDETYKLAASQMASSQTSCRCERSDRHANFKTQLRDVYTRIRRFNNPALARVLSDHYETHIPFHDPFPALVNNWISYLDFTVRFGEPILLSVLADVTIHRGGVLVTDRKLKSFRAWNIWIHSRGQMVHKSTYIMVWANKIASFLDLQDIVSSFNRDVPWRLQP
jgi:hypothetical protein